MSVNKEDINMEMDKEKFRELSKDIKPVIMDMERVLNKHDVECISSLTMSTDGYFRFNVHDTKWEFVRADSNSKPMISYHICEEV